ncbi:MAG: FMN-binding glutamate synthase family protein [Gammaproteobacteria bacterium]|nr:FMN-binding glutamate synthase family protein [Gammaproteobacteria bacterium]
MDVMSEQFTNFVLPVMQFMQALFILAIGAIAVTVLVIYILDVTQSKHAIRRNYPVVGRFRYFFEHIGEFFRQYFFAMDREEMPFNRAQRSWVYRAAKNIDTTIGFGSTRDLTRPGTVMFANCPFPTLGEDAVPPGKVTIGPDCRTPYTTCSLLNISGMSFGAISKPAVLALSRGAHDAGCWLNTGEGGLSQYHLEGGCDLVYQIGTAKNGVRDLAGNLNDDRLREAAAHENVRMFEIKLSQGAKPGKGGILPGEKVTQEIADIRGIEAGKDALSPNRHTDINSNADLLDVIHRIREVTGKPVGFKAVVGSLGWLDNLFTEVVSRGVDSAPDFITVDGGDGGTGAAPMALIDDMGLPLRESLPMVVDKLNEYGLRDRVRVVASGKLITPADVAWALCMGANFVASARGFMFALGCIQALQCNKNTCPTGITTHNKRMQKGLDPMNKSVRVANYVNTMVYEVGMIAHSCGVREPRELHRAHARIVTENGLSVPMNELHPDIVDTVTEVARQTDEVYAHASE